MIKRLATKVLAAPPIWGFLRKRALRDNPLTVLCYATLGLGQGGVDGWTVLSEKDFRAQLTDLKSYYIQLFFLLFFNVLFHGKT